MKQNLSLRQLIHLQKYLHAVTARSESPQKTQFYPMLIRQISSGREREKNHTLRRILDDI